MASGIWGLVAYSCNYHTPSPVPTFYLSLSCFPLLFYHHLALSRQSGRPTGMHLHPLLSWDLLYLAT